MCTRLTWVALIACLLAVSISIAAAEPPAKGKLLVATEVIRGDIFVQTVVLLLHYDETGAVGLVVNRPTDVALDEVLEDPTEFSEYEGRMYWGGPVQMNSIRALMQTDTPAKGADLILDSVYLVPFNDELKKSLGDTSRLHFFIGYAGWAPGQLDRELEIGSWHVVPASADIVFADDPGLVWQRLAPRDDLRTSIEMKNSLSGLDHRG
jgi:putative transcriptional regulator